MRERGPLSVPWGPGEQAPPLHGGCEVTSPSPKGPRRIPEGFTKDRTHGHKDKPWWL